jgi:hypothetical protein
MYLTPSSALLHISASRRYARGVAQYSRGAWPSIQCATEICRAPYALELCRSAVREACTLAGVNGILGSNNNIRIAGTIGLGLM